MCLFRKEIVSCLLIASIVIYYYSLDLGGLAVVIRLIGRNACRSGFIAADEIGGQRPRR